jgi:hypothetical protein
MCAQKRAEDYVPVSAACQIADSCSIKRGLAYHPALIAPPPSFPNDALVLDIDRRGADLASLFTISGQA